MPVTPRKRAAIGNNASKPHGYDRVAVPENPLGEFAEEVATSMAAVATDLAEKKVIRSWNDAKLREQTRGLIISNVEATENARARRRQLLTRDQVADRDAKRDELILGRLHELVDYAASLVPLDQQQAARKAAQEWLAVLRGKIADDLESVK